MPSASEKAMRTLRSEIWANYNHSCNDLSVQDMGRVKRIWYLSAMRAAKVQASLRIRAVSPEPLLLAHTSSES